MQQYTVYLCKLLYMFRMVSPPIIRSSYHCIYSTWHYWDRYCYLSWSWIDGRRDRDYMKTQFPSSHDHDR